MKNRGEATVRDRTVDPALYGPGGVRWGGPVRSCPTRYDCRSTDRRLAVINMKTVLVSNRRAMGAWVARQAAGVIRETIDAQGHARIVVATGASQLEVLSMLVQQSGIAWERVEAFHLDEYIGIDGQHPASFCRYLRERFAEKVPLAEFHYLPGDRDPREVIAEVGPKLQSAPIDVALVGIGENAHLAFNDPPADFETTKPYLIVQLDTACRNQQVGEGWFESLPDVPTHAISMSIQQILQCKRIFCSVPDSQKAEAVRRTLMGEIDPSIPASILKTHPATTLIIDEAAAGDLPPEVIEGLDRPDDAS